MVVYLPPNYLELLRTRATASKKNLSQQLPSPSAPTRAATTTTTTTSGWFPVWDGKRRSEPGAYKEWKREIKASQLAYDIQDDRYAPLLFLATKDDARDVLWDLDAESLTSLGVIMNRLSKEFEKLDFEERVRLLGLREMPTHSWPADVRIHPRHGQNVHEDGQGG